MMDKITKLMFAISFMPIIISFFITGFSLLTILLFIIPAVFYFMDAFPVEREEEE